MPMFPPQRGMGFDSNTSRLLSRKSRIHSGSRFISEISATIRASSPLRALKTYFSSLRKSYLLISPTGSSVGLWRSVAMDHVRVDW